MPKTSSAEMTKDAALIRNADLPPSTATATPPNAPPRTVPTPTAAARAAVARVRSAAGTNTTSKAGEAGPNGALTTEATAASAINWSADWLNATATNTPAD